MSPMAFFDEMARIDAILADQSVDARIRLTELTSFLRNEKLRVYFFAKLNDPSWLQALREAGFFARPLEPIRGQQQGTIQFQPWPSSQYLARIAKDAPREVLDVALQVETTNPSIHDDLTRAALAMPPEIAAKWAEQETRWIHDCDNLYLGLPERIAELVSYLSAGHQADVALNLAAALFA